MKTFPPDYQLDLTTPGSMPDLTGVTAPAGNVQMSALPAPNVQPNAPHSLTPNAASTPQPSVSSAYTETQPSRIEKTFIMNL